MKDPRLATQIKELDYALGILRNLKPRDYRRRRLFKEYVSDIFNEIIDEASDELLEYLWERIPSDARTN